MNSRQEQRLEDIVRLLSVVADGIESLLRLSGGDPVRRRSGLSDLTVASNERSAELERDRREAERANGWAPDSELSYRDQFRRLEAQVREYEREVDSRLGDPDDPRPSQRLPWNRRPNERLRSVERPRESRREAERYGAEEVRERRREDLP